MIEAKKGIFGLILITLLGLFVIHLVTFTRQVIFSLDRKTNPKWVGTTQFVKRTPFAPVCVSDLNTRNMKGDSNKKQRMDLKILLSIMLPLAVLSVSAEEYQGN